MKGSRRLSFAFFRSLFFFFGFRVWVYVSVLSVFAWVGRVGRSRSVCACVRVWVWVCGVCPGVLTDSPAQLICDM